jgi:hypothetical protein
MEKQSQTKPIQSQNLPAIASAKAGKPKQTQILGFCLFGFSFII